MESLTFKNFMAEVPTCVAILATSSDSAIQACTVSSFLSFDVERPGALSILQGDSKTLKSIKDSGKFSANILAEDQSDLARHFSTKSKDHLFEDNELFDFNSEFSMPYLKIAKSVSFCELENLINFKNSSIILGRVVGITILQEKNPLIYSKRQYFALGETLT